MDNTNTQYNRATHICKNIFLQKNHDYGTSWRVLRPISIIDQIYIKAKRIRTIQEDGRQLIADKITDEFIGIANYAVIGLVQLKLGNEDMEEVPVDRLSTLYDEQIDVCKTLMQNKNHDYGEAWREMSQEGLTDLILQKLYRMKQILKNDGHTLISEGLGANYMDMINYAIFALIKEQSNGASIN